MVHALFFLIFSFASHSLKISPKNASFLKNKNSLIFSLQTHSIFSSRFSQNTAGNTDSSIGDLMDVSCPVSFEKTNDSLVCLLKNDKISDFQKFAQMKEFYKNGFFKEKHYYIVVFYFLINSNNIKKIFFKDCVMLFLEDFPVYEMLHQLTIFHPLDRLYLPDFLYAYNQVQFPDCENPVKHFHSFGNLINAAFEKEKLIKLRTVEVLERMQSVQMVLDFFKEQASKVKIDTETKENPFHKKVLKKCKHRGKGEQEKVFNSFFKELKRKLSRSDDRFPLSKLKDIKAFLHKEYELEKQQEENLLIEKFKKEYETFQKNKKTGVFVRSFLANKKMDYFLKISVLKKISSQKKLFACDYWQIVLYHLLNPEESTEECFLNECVMGFLKQMFVDRILCFLIFQAPSLRQYLKKILDTFDSVDKSLEENFSMRFNKFSQTVIKSFFPQNIQEITTIELSERMDAVKIVIDFFKEKKNREFYDDFFKKLKDSIRIPQSNTSSEVIRSLDVLDSILLEENQTEIFSKDTFQEILESCIERNQQSFSMAIDRCFYFIFDETLLKDDWSDEYKMETVIPLCIHFLLETFDKKIEDPSSVHNSALLLIRKLLCPCLPPKMAKAFVPVLQKMLECKAKNTHFSPLPLQDFSILFLFEHYDRMDCKKRIEFLWDFCVKNNFFNWNLELNRIVRNIDCLSPHPLQYLFSKTNFSSVQERSFFKKVYHKLEEKDKSFLDLFFSEKTLENNTVLHIFISKLDFSNPFYLDDVLETVSDILPLFANHSLDFTFSNNQGITPVDLLVKQWELSNNVDQKWLMSLAGIFIEELSLSFQEALIFVDYCRTKDCFKDISLEILEQILEKQMKTASEEEVQSLIVFECFFLASAFKKCGLIRKLLATTHCLSLSSVFKKCGLTSCDPLFFLDCGWIFWEKSLQLKKLLPVYCQIFLKMLQIDGKLEECEDLIWKSRMQSKKQGGSSFSALKVFIKIRIYRWIKLKWQKFVLKRYWRSVCREMDDFINLQKIVPNSDSDLDKKKEFCEQFEKKLILWNKFIAKKLLVCTDCLCEVKKFA